MTRECEAAQPVIPAPITLWLSLRVGHQNWLFDFPPGEERAIVVGSFARANVRLEGRRVAPIHFHFEREGDAIHLIPGYRDELLVNGVAVYGALELAPTSRIQFAGLQLEAHFFVIDSELLPASSHVASRREPERYLFRIPDPMQRTSVAFAVRARDSEAPRRTPPSHPEAPCHAKPSDSEAPHGATPMPKALRTARLATEMRALGIRSEAVASDLGAARNETNIEPSRQAPRTHPITITPEGRRQKRGRARLTRWLVAATHSLAGALARLLRRRRH